jgi:hypothetical protein
MRKREKLFGLGRPVALDRNAKARVMHLARCLARQKAPGRQRGILTRAALDVLGAEFGTAFPYSTAPSRSPFGRSSGLFWPIVPRATQGLCRAGAGGPSNRRLAPGVGERASELLGGKHRDFGPTLACISRLRFRRWRRRTAPAGRHGGSFRPDRNADSRYERRSRETRRANVSRAALLYSNVAKIQVHGRGKS